MYAIVGIAVEIFQEKIGGAFERHETEEIIALFTTKEKAEEYLQKSRLKQIKKQTFAGDIVFKKKSLLAYYESAEVQKYIKEELEVNPAINF